MKPPSGWHADASGRDAGHDELQIAVYEYLTGQPQHRSYVGHGVPWERREVLVEYPFKQGEVVLGFADVCEVWVPADKESRASHLIPERHFIAFEVKPRIHSVGAVIRQVRATIALARQTVHTSTDARRPTCSVFAVVPYTDPKLTQLRSVFPGVVWAWKDGRPEATDG